MSGKRGANVPLASQRRTRNPAVIYADINEARADMDDITLKIENLSAELGLALAEARRRRSLSQESAGALVGISRDMVCLLELGQRGKTDPPYIERLVQALSE